MNMKGIVYIIFGMIITGCTTIPVDHSTVLEAPWGSPIVPEGGQVATDSHGDHYEKETPQVTYFRKPDPTIQVASSSRILPSPSMRNVYISAKAKEVSFLNQPVDPGMYTNAVEITKLISFNTTQLPTPVIDLPLKPDRNLNQEQSITLVENQQDEPSIVINHISQAEPVFHENLANEEMTVTEHDQISDTRIPKQTLSVSTADIIDKPLNLPGYGWQVTEIEQLNRNSDGNNNLILYAGGRFGQEGLSIVIELGYTSTGMTLGLVSTGDSPLSRPTIELPLRITLTRTNLQTGKNEQQIILMEPEQVPALTKELEERNTPQEPTNNETTPPEMIKIESLDTVFSQPDTSQQLNKVDTNQGVPVAFREEPGKNQNHTIVPQLPGDQILFNRARSLSEIKDPSSIREAINLYRRILQEYPLSRHYTAARAAALQLERNYILVR